MGTTAEERSLAAEERAVEEGHRAFVTEGGAIRVVSDTHHDKAYKVTFLGRRAGDPVVFTCRPEFGRKLYADDHLHVTGDPGCAPCKHAALAGRRLEREGLALWDGGRWLVTERAERMLDVLLPAPDDPFERL